MAYDNQYSNAGSGAQTEYNSNLQIIWRINNYFEACNRASLKSGLAGLKERLKLLQVIDQELTPYMKVKHKADHAACRVNDIYVRGQFNYQWEQSAKQMLDKYESFLRIVQKDIGAGMTGKKDEGSLIV